MTRTALSSIPRALPFAVLFAATILFAPSPARSQEPETRPAGESDGNLETLAEKLDELEAGQRELLNRLDRLEASLRESVDRASDFSRIVVRVESREGKPLPGFVADLRLASQQERAATAIGTSDEQGVALDRAMPYGEYRLSLKEPSGWSTYLRDVTIEVGQPLELTIVAPDPAQRGRLILTSDLKERTFARFPFGEIRERHGIAYSVSFTPEPDQAGQSEGLPTVGDGIEQVAASIVVSAKTRLKQPDGETIEWRWRSTGGASQEKLLATADGVAVWLETDGKSAKPVEGADDADVDIDPDVLPSSEPPATSAPDESHFAGLDSDETVGYLEVLKVEPPQPSLAFDVPAGEIEVAVTGVYGKAAPDVLDALQVERSDDRSVWLNVNLQNESQWIGRLFDQRDWRPTEDLNTVVRRVVAIEPGEEETVELASP